MGIYHFLQLFINNDKSVMIFIDKWAKTEASSGTINYEFDKVLGIATNR